MHTKSGIEFAKSSSLYGSFMYLMSTLWIKLKKNVTICMAHRSEHHSHKRQTTPFYPFIIMCKVLEICKMFGIFRYNGIQREKEDINCGNWLCPVVSQLVSCALLIAASLEYVHFETVTKLISVHCNQKSISFSA